MTDIPGTENTHLSENDKERPPIIPMSTVNVSVLKKGDKKSIENDSIWYEKLQFWLIPGSLLSLLFILISLKYKNFIVFVPIGPIISIISWYVKKITKIHGPKS